jgi:hypothetical protein
VHERKLDGKDGQDSESLAYFRGDGQLVRAGGGTGGDIGGGGVDCDVFETKREGEIDCGDGIFLRSVI